MRRFILCFFALLAGTLLTTSCELFEFGEGKSQGSGGGNNNSTHYSLSISPTKVELPASAGSFSIRVKSNQAWTASLNNSGNGGIRGLRLSNYSGYGNGVITVSYDRVLTDCYHESGTIIVVGSESGTEVCSCGRYRYY